MNNLFLTISLLGLGLFILSTVLTRIYASFASAKGLIDVPGERSSHTRPTPRGGGLVFAGLWLTLLLIGSQLGYWTSKEVLAFGPGTLIAVLTGFLDDTHSLSAKLRLKIQFVACLLATLALGNVNELYHLHFLGVTLGYCALPLVLISLMWGINLFNFMDGLDGLAAVEALFVFGVGAFFFWEKSVFPMMFLSLMLVAVILGFLVWNWPKARIFMGDSGSYCIGFLTSIFAFVGALWYDIPLALWIILTGVFWFDATVTLIRRSLQGKNPAIPHRDHAFQWAAHELGYSHRRVVITVIGINCILAAIACICFWYPEYSRKGILLTLALLSLIYWRLARKKEACQNSPTRDI